MSPDEQALIRAACTVLELVSRQLSELDLTIAVGQRTAGQRFAGREIAKQLRRTVALASEALREIEPIVRREARGK